MTTPGHTERSTGTPAHPERTVPPSPWTPLRIVGACVLTVACWVGAGFLWFWAELSGFRVFFGEHGRRTDHWAEYFGFAMGAAIALTVPLFVLAALDREHARNWRSGACGLAALVIVGALIRWFII